MSNRVVHPPSFKTSCAETQMDLGISRIQFQRALEMYFRHRGIPLEPVDRTQIELRPSMSGLNPHRFF
jgi:hypothetical protein